MKFLIHVLILLAAAAPAAALTQPLKINYQGKLLDPSTNGPRNGSFTMCFAVYPDPALGGPCASAPYHETQSVVVTNGVFSVQIGAVTPLGRELFLGPSAYLGVTVTSPADPGGEMTPRQQLVMSPYAFTANQLSDSSEVRLIAGPTYSTFTSAGNFTVPGGISASSGTFTSGITASSGTFLAAGPNQYSIVASSGIHMNAGTLDIRNTSGLRADDTGISISTLDFTPLAAEPAGSAGFLYYNASSDALKISNNVGQYNYIFGQSLGRQYLVTTDNTAATAAKAAAATILIVPFYLPGPMMVNQMRVRVTTALGAAGDIGLYSETGTLLLNGGSSSLTTTVAAKTIVPVQTGNARFLEPGQYYAAVTWNSTTGIVGGNNLTVAGLVNRVGTVVGGGLVLPASITVTAITAGALMPFFEINP